MADFKIKATVWLHQRPWKRGSEDALQEAGFSPAQKREQLRRRAIVLLDVPAADVINRADIAETAKNIGIRGEENVEAFTDTVEKVASADDDAKPLTDHTVKELKQIAKDEGVQLGRAVRRKDDIIAAIEASRAESAAVDQPIDATPTATWMARENGIELRSIEGTGANGRITAKDVERALNE